MNDGFCAKCGACTAVCPVYQVTGQESLTARGRIHLLEKLATEKHSRNYHDIFSKCLLCQACRRSCPRHLDLPAMVVEARHSFPRLSGCGSFKGSLLKHCLEHQKLLAGLSGLGKLSTPLLKKLPVNSGLRIRLGLIEETSQAETAPVMITDPVRPDSSARFTIFPGCLARHLKPEITAGMAKLLSNYEEAQATSPDDQVCCGLATYSAGDIEAARELARTNISAFAGSELPIIVPCASCLSHLKNYPELLGEDKDWQPLAEKFAARVTILSSFLAAEKHPPSPHPAPDITGVRRVVYHTPCHLRYQGSAADATREILRSIPGIELVELPSGSRCCGFGGLFNLAHPELSKRIASELTTELIKAEPDLIVTDCSGCLIQIHLQLAAIKSNIKVQHLVSLLSGSD